MPSPVLTFEDLDNLKGMPEEEQPLAIEQISAMRSHPLAEKLQQLHGPSQAELDKAMEEAKTFSEWAGAAERSQQVNQSRKYLDTLVQNMKDEDKKPMEMY